NSGEVQEDGWRFHIALAGQKGSVATLPGLPAADIDINFYDDIFGNINGAIMLLCGARKGRLGVIVDITYTDIESENITPGPFFSQVNSRAKTWMGSIAVFYRLVEKQGAFIDLTAGARYWSMDSELILKQGLIAQRQVSQKEDWVDPMVGLKGRLPLGESGFFISGFMNIGGFKYDVAQQGPVLGLSWSF
ncbi:hypothetical protein, partial [Dethiosulfatarculus sandiegensis]